MKIMILGGSENQKPLFETAIDMGVNTVLCDYSETATCVDLADSFYKISILDYNAILEAANKEMIDGIVTNSEPAMNIATRIGNELGLPSNKFSSIEILLNKSKFRQFQKENGFYSPKSISFCYSEKLIIKDKISDFKFPLMIKPIGTSGSRGASRITNIEEMDVAIDLANKYSKRNQIIVEEFIQRDHEYVIGGDIFVYKSEIIFWGIMNSMRDKYGDDNVPTGTSYPTFLPEKRLAIFKRKLSEIIKKLEITMGSFNIEAAFNSGDDLFFIEINPRNGGNSIPKLLKVCTGIDINILNIKSALGMEIHEGEYRASLNKPCSTYIVHSNREGLFDKVTMSENLKSKMFHSELSVNKGDKVEEFHNSDGMLGTLFFCFNSLEEMEKYVSDFDENISVSIYEDKM